MKKKIAGSDFMPLFTLFIYLLGATAGSFVGGLWGGLGIGCGLVLFVAAWQKNRTPPYPDKHLAALMLVTLAVIMALNFLSIDPHRSWRLWFSLVTIFVPLLLLSCRALPARALHPRFAEALFVVSLLTAVVLFAELSLHMPLLHLIEKADAAASDYNRGMSALALLAFPVMAGAAQGGWLLKRSRLWAVAAFIAVLMLPASLTESRASKLAIVVGLCATGLVYLWPVLTRRALAVFLASCAAWPFAAQMFFTSFPETLGHLPASWHARVEIWDDISYRIAERPILGWGLGTTQELSFQSPHSAQYVFLKATVPHPHNAIAQLWVELGIPGLVLGMLFALWMLKKTERLDQHIAPFAVGTWVAALCISLVAYNFWTDALWGSFALTAFAFAMLDKNAQKA